MERRDVLRIGGLTLAATLAGCVDDSPSSDTATDPESDSDDMASELDLREANVVGVEFEERDEGYRFDVTLHHDDDGEDGYANWWQVETLDGTQLGRRVLTHPHSRQPFTRWDIIEIPDSVTCVVVRGHDQTHEYGGRAVVVNLDSGAQNAISQGSERQTVSESDCP
ncbi:hypothetical protein EGH24_02460 [Halonotius terrestris]|uniref:Uncharacterized protein n=1 Tax=Halonotius terrestris TaxID=2487750 RepID=A0A8J8PBS8_9EURY|nr:hypothetical protein [Halonotius terrestris]TQQ83669.1 hypothetical protein EGH24_02460 [Halonotius terrestris]